MKRLAFLLALAISVSSWADQPTTKPAADYPALRKKLAELQSKIDALTAENKQLKDSLSEAQDKIASLTPATKPAASVQTTKKYEIGTSREDFLAAYPGANRLQDDARFEVYAIMDIEGDSINNGFREVVVKVDKRTRLVTDWKRGQLDGPDPLPPNYPKNR